MIWITESLHSWIEILFLFSPALKSRVIFCLLITQTDRLAVSHSKNHPSCWFFQHLIFFHEVLSVTGSGWLSQWGSCLLHKSCFNDKKQATSHIQLPTMTMNWHFPGNTGVCLHQMHSNQFRLQWTCFITTCKPGTCVVPPVRPCLYITYNDKDHRWWWQMIWASRHCR